LEHDEHDTGKRRTGTDRDRSWHPLSQHDANAGFANISVTSTHEFGEGLHSAIIRATKA
jgi:hypothetical protein